MQSVSPGFPEASPELEALFAGRFSAGRSVREQHGRDEGHLPAEPPDGVIFPKTTEEVMLSIKRALDPLNIMNPGKIFSAD